MNTNRTIAFYKLALNSPLENEQVITQVHLDGIFVINARPHTALPLGYNYNIIRV